MRMHITGRDRVLERANQLANIDEKLDEIARRLCEVGQPWIWAWHGNHAQVWSEPTENGYRIVAEGEQVLFIEFGTGDSAGIHAAEYDAVPEVVRPGSWSEQDKQQYSNLGFWFWGGAMFRETPPHPAFYDAYRAMVEALPQIADEVFSR